MTGAAAHPIIGKWRIVEMELWDKDFLDLVEPAYIAFDDRGGEFEFGAVTGGLDCSYTAGAIDFTWAGCDEMDEACGDGWAVLEDDGTLNGEICFHQGDESGFKARQW